MIKLFVNAVSASAGGGVTYLHNFITHVLRRRDVAATILMSSEGARAFRELPTSASINFLQCSWPGSAALRYWREQWELPRMIRGAGADVLLSTGNVALRKSPVPQILLSRNALYTTPDFFRDLLCRREYMMYIAERCKAVVAKRSVRWADCTIAPSEAFACALRRWTGQEVVPVYHGFDKQSFFTSRDVPGQLEQHVKSSKGCVRLLFVSHYNYYRNFETLLRAVPMVCRQLAPRPVRLFLTCQLHPELNSGSYNTGSAAALIKQLGLSEEVVQLGAVSHGCLHHLYRTCDLYVTPSYAESFAHPLVEAMAAGLPIVASDLPVHREICSDAAFYVPTFSPTAFAEEIVSLLRSPERKQRMAEAGLRRSADFSWADHVTQIVRIAKELASTRPLQIAVAAAAS